MAKGYQGPAERLQRYGDLIATNPTIKRSGASMPYTSVSGHMFSFLDPSGRMSLRLRRMTGRSSWTATTPS